VGDLNELGAVPLDQSTAATTIAQVRQEGRIRLRRTKWAAAGNHVAVTRRHTPQSFSVRGRRQTPRTRRPLCVSFHRGSIRECPVLCTGQQGETYGKAFIVAVTTYVRRVALCQRRTSRAGGDRGISVWRIGDNLLHVEGIARDSHRRRQRRLLACRSALLLAAVVPTSGLEPLPSITPELAFRRGGTGVVGSSVSLLVLPAGACRGCPAPITFQQSPPVYVQQ